MGIAYIAARDEQSCEALQKIIEELGFRDIRLFSSAAGLREALTPASSGLVLINTPLSDETGVALAGELNGSLALSILLIVPENMLAEAQSYLKGKPVFFVPKPVNRQFLIQALKFILNTRSSFEILADENAKLKQKMEDLKIIDRAKCCLIQYLGMSEPQAHRYIQKQAMDLRASPKSIAENILTTYEM